MMRAPTATHVLRDRLMKAQRPRSLILRSIAKQCVSKDEAFPETTGASFETQPAAAPQDEVGVVSQPLRRRAIGQERTHV
jgi:hypothetical protein